ncbi:MAG: histidinol-phosphate aminotransferase family protein [Lachnospiraceae bacterium]|nr:histidinol-phosphate aminotransferase family protein [Lachnospiraceae bacterium]
MEQLKDTYKHVIRTANYFSDLDRTQYIRMDGNESIDGLPEEFIKDVLGEIDSNCLATYPNQRQCTEAIADRLNIPRENIFVTNGSDRAIKMIFEVYVDKNDRVIMTNPTFEMYGVYTTMYGAEAVLVDYELDDKKEFEFPFDKYMKEIKKGAKMAIIVNPDNPTGAIIEPDKLMQLLEYTEKTGTLVIVDEAYYGFYDTSVISKILQYNNLIVLRTFSKIMGLAGVRLGFLAANEDIIYDVKRIAAPAAVSAISLKFGEKLMQRTDILEQLFSDYRREKKYLEKRLSENNILYVNSHANFLLIPCEKDLKATYEAFKENGILIACKLNKYIRINIGNERITDEFIRVYKKVVL